jgi:hypothetical protein
LLDPVRDAVELDIDAVVGCYAFWHAANLMWRVLQSRMTATSAPEVCRLRGARRITGVGFDDEEGVETRSRV